MMVIAYTTAFALAVYASFVFYCLGGWKRSMRKQQVQSRKEAITVVIPARNEESAIAERIHQLLPEIGEGSELIIVDDDSQDATAQAVDPFLSDPRVRYLCAEGRGKKAAISTGILAANTDVILLSDADVASCPGFIRELQEAFHPKVDMIVLPVLVKQERGLLAGTQLMDQALLTGMAMGAATQGTPLWASGAALAFRKSVFLDVQGYDGNEKVASGDDVFLLHKFKKAQKKVVVLNSSKTTVWADACSSWSALVSQRLRWGSKVWRYRDPFTLGISFVGLMRWCALPVTIMLVSIGLWWPFVLLVLTVLLDLFLARGVLRFNRLKLSAWTWMVVPVFYLFFGLFLLLASLVHTPQWKGRKITT